jgi:hypothetical protein
MKAYRHLVKHALAKGLTVSVFDGEEWQVKRTTSEKAVFDAIDSVEESQLRFRDAEGNQVGWALVIDYNEEPELSVVDHTDNEFMNEWSKSYDETLKA